MHFLQIAVHNIGQGKLTLNEHDEDYICTFPSGFGRSILTVPWVELGGKVTLTCPKTGYNANVEFKCKQFFSSDVNKVSVLIACLTTIDPFFSNQTTINLQLSAEVFAPGNKKPFLKVDGEWNGKMMAKWSTGKNEVFIDVTKSPLLYPKICKKISEQERFESR